MERERTLILGNGFSRTIFKNVPSWAHLFDNVNSSIKNYTILYEVSLQKNKLDTEDEIKNIIVDKIKKHNSAENINDNILHLEHFGVFLRSNNINNIITTNYDKGIEIILCEKCQYKEIIPQNLISEEIYSIRTYKEFINEKNNHKIKLWKIHGDVDRIKSITLGFDQYCGSLSKLSEYIKGKYISDKGPKCNISMIEKCKTQHFDYLSWAELFFYTDVYIVGLGMDFSEIDIWWLLNKHMRIQRKI